MSSQQQLSKQDASAAKNKTLLERKKSRASRKLLLIDSKSSSRYTNTAAARLANLRRKIRINIDGIDMTPKGIDKAKVAKQFEITNSKGEKTSRWDATTNIISQWCELQNTHISVLGASTKLSLIVATMKTSLDDIINIPYGLSGGDDKPYWRITADEKVKEPPQPDKLPQFIKIILTESPTIIFYEKTSTCVPKDSDDAKLVEDDNKAYDYLTIGKGKSRRKSDAETQTSEILYKSRDVNTETIKRIQVGSYVSNFDMFDTYKDLEHVTESVEFGAEQKLDITTYKVDGKDQFVEISKLPAFNLATMLTERILAGNIFREKQRRFRNMFLPDPHSLDAKYLYTLQELWAFPRPCTERRAVSAISWCPQNGDIVAVAYGIYTFAPIASQTTGYVYIWSIKNPVNPERKYSYTVPVISLEFSPFVPQLLAIGFYDGNVEVRDITHVSGTAVAVSHRSTSPGCEAVNQIHWIQVGAGEEHESEPILTVTQNGTIMKYRLVNSPYLIGFQQMKLTRVEGTPEGLKVKKNQQITESSRHPQALALTIHPTKNDLYYVLTDEGCMHKCSVNYSHQHIDLLRVHDGHVYSMEFSPWSPKLFLTCGSDWCIRIWMEGILEPLFKLSNGIGAVHCAYWSPTHSTVIVGVTRNAVEVWDIRRSTLKPVSVHELCKSYLTVAKFANCGRSIAVGNEAGKVFICAFEDMPFPPYFQYEQLEAAVMKAILAFPGLTNDVKSLGFWGYPDKK